MYDLAILGGGPAGVSAGVYAARKQLKTVLITESFGGQSTDSAGIENWIGTINISGIDLGKSLEAHLRAFAGKTVDIVTDKRVTEVSQIDGGFKIATESEVFDAKTVLVATGSARRKLDIPGADIFENKGITYCASCDGPLFSGADVVVIGGGNAGFESAAQLLSYCKSVTILNRSDVFRGDEMTVEKVMSHPNMKAIKNAIPKEIKGDKFVSSIIYTDALTGEDKEIFATGIFVEIGLMPTTGFVEGLVELNPIKQIVVNPKNQRASVVGVWAAGDCTDGLYHQNNIASGDAVKALEDIYLYIHAGK
ncbi:MAG: FAD-dependent oxidoreductase [bacterium]|nr:FAD-dependent oxidoreductase [bacterium]